MSEQSKPSSYADNLRGALFMVIGMAGFTVNDLFVKAVGQNLNLGQTLLIRGCFASLAIFAMAYFMGQIRPVRELLSKMMMLRAMGEMLATWTFVYAVFHIPIANVSAIFQALPLALTLYAAFFFKETIGWRRMLAILIGFAGVLLIIRPGYEGFSFYSVLVLVSVAACVVRDISTRQMPKSIPGLMITLVTAIGVTLMGAVTALFQPWNPVSNHDLGFLASTSIFLVIGYYFVVSAMRIGDIGFVSPFRYTVLLFSITGGIIAFDEVPDQITLLGAAIIVATGIYTLYRERVVNKQKITQPPVRT